ncbi:outer membrane beta-barrel protein [Carboxylicivirga sp. M1479]|uniref:outer membrane beta-barrel protein n=1 Tax=Carboxylicivirga sp. M1479 TaxID=2594476 RepID=UPI001177373B|nr:outer membrane beta-barrel protein [Carboxylicivirga sp. M1479]TRX71317.1 outer membrane beta-barrel protein [Carboxylicivirga sp. M1479]
MRKVLLLLMVAVLSIGAVGQEKESKGMWVGGGIGFHGGDNDGWNLSPQWGMMFNENMGVGANLVFSDDDWMVEPYFRYYLGVTDNFKFFGDGALAFGGNDDSSQFRIQVRPGVQYWFTPKWSLAAATPVLSFHSVNYDDDNREDISTSFFGLDATDLSFSLYFHF